jgi:hypothetical protein
MAHGPRPQRAWATSPLRPSWSRGPAPTPKTVNSFFWKKG